jgi:hypothetical protein
MQVIGKQTSQAASLVLLYVVLAVLFIGFMRWRLKPSTDVQRKDFEVFVGVILTGDAAFVGMFISFFTLSSQIQAARELESHKAELSEKLALLNGAISQQGAFLSRALDAQSSAYNKLFVASAVCYRELEKLARGEFDRNSVDRAEGDLTEAQALSANLDDEDRRIVIKMVQATLDIADEARDLKSKGEQLKKDREEIWQRRAPALGREMNALRDRSPFYNKKVASQDPIANASPG